MVVYVEDVNGWEEVGFVMPENVSSGEGRDTVEQVEIQTPPIKTISIGGRSFPFRVLVLFAHLSKMFWNLATTTITHAMYKCLPNTVR